MQQQMEDLLETPMSRKALMNAAAQRARDPAIPSLEQLLYKAIADHATPSSAYVTFDLGITVEDEHTRRRRGVTVSLMLAIERRVVINQSRPFLRLVQISIQNEQEQGKKLGTRLISALEEIARREGRAFMVECVNNSRWRAGFFEPRVASGHYCRYPGSDTSYWRHFVVV